MKRSSLVCRLNRALYGLKLVHQASFERLRLSLMQLRFQSSRAYQSLFVGIWIKHLYKICIFGLLKLLLLMKSAEFIHELVTEMTLE